MSLASIQMPLAKSDMPISWPTPLRSRAKSAERGHDPRPGPEGSIVEGRALALRALGAVAGEAGVDEAWMHAPERRVVHAERGELLAPEVGQEHVAPPHQRVRHLAPLGAPES